MHCDSLLIEPQSILGVGCSWWLQGDAEGAADRWSRSNVMPERSATGTNQFATPMMAASEVQAPPDNSHPATIQLRAPCHNFESVFTLIPDRLLHDENIEED